MYIFFWLGLLSSSSLQKLFRMEFYLDFYKSQRKLPCNFLFCSVVAFISMNRVEFHSVAETVNLDSYTPLLSTQSLPSRSILQVYMK